ncbi:DUF3472 domain-containing protein [Wocania ichthyoenteri]|uniref:DUF3472 domain-containing protein n=1 Tax=Wocania ichthyoenteri TaxID=1230531 RepID=UPI00138E55DA|nr:DUF3472 domain-containing protein [Wocania ichthyoenteri]
MNSFTIEDLHISIPFAANSWMDNNPDKMRSKKSNSNIQNWTDGTKKIKSYFKTDKTGQLHLALKAKVDQGGSKLKVTLNGVSKDIELKSTHLDTVIVGTFDVKQIGYQSIEIERLNKKSEASIVIDQLMIGGDATIGNLYYIKDDVYWGRRGPSVHLKYPIPEAASDIEWFYSEITVPKDNDIVGSYFMANGFKEGYFGMQVNSETERRFLFSVWSPYKTNNPSEIPKDQRITLLKKGKDVIAGKFGHEGSGGQSYRKYLWKADTTYKFLLKGVPSINNSTDYTAFVFAPEVGKWELMVSFRRPKTTTYLKRFHSFLENFQPEMGDKTRKAFYTNQWVYDTKDSWYSITNTQFAADATAKKNARLDYSGGVENNKFFLENCGFFNHTTAINSVFKIETTKKEEAPNIDFHLLEGLIE